MRVRKHILLLTFMSLSSWVIGFVEGRSLKGKKYLFGGSLRDDSTNLRREAMVLELMPKGTKLPSIGAQKGTALPVAKKSFTFSPQSTSSPTAWLNDIPPDNITRNETASNSTNSKNSNGKAKKSKSLKFSKASKASKTKKGSNKKGSKAKTQAPKKKPKQKVPKSKEKLTRAPSLSPGKRTLMCSSFCFEKVQIPQFLLTFVASTKRRTASDISSVQYA